MPIFVDICGQSACVTRSTETKTLHGLYCRKLRRQHLCAFDVIDFLRSKNKENDCFQHKCANEGTGLNLAFQLLLFQLNSFACMPVLELAILVPFFVTNYVRSNFIDRLCSSMKIMKKHYCLNI